MVSFAPTVPYKINTKAQNLANYIPLFLPLAFGFVFRQYAAEIVSDKKNKIQIGMRMMGLEGAVYWGSWVLIMFISSTFFSFCIAILFKYGNVLQHSDVGILILFFWLFSASMIFFVIMFTCFVSDPQTAQVVLKRQVTRK